MFNVGAMWDVVSRRVGKAEKALLLGALATAIAVPIAVAGPVGSPNLQTTPTVTSVSTSAVSTSVAVSSVATTSTAVSTSAGVVRVTLTTPGGMTLGATITVLALCADTGKTVTVQAITLTGTPITATTTVGAGCTVAVPTSLQGLRVSSVSIVLGAGGTTAQTPAQTPSQLPAALPHTGAGGMAS